MKSHLLTACLSVLLLSRFVAAAENAKPKLLDALHSIDPKTTSINELKVKPVTTKDPKHPKGLEFIADFSKPGTWPNFTKKFPEHTISSKKFSGVRFAAKSDTNSKVNFQFRSSIAQPDGRPVGYYVEIQGTPEWKEFTFDFSQFKTWEQKVVKDGVHKVFKAGDPILESDYELFNHCQFVFDVAKRGDATAAHLIVDNLVLLSK